MKDYPLEKYKFYIAGNKVIACTTFAGKTVRATAICHSNDDFDLNLGKKLAAARCNLKVAEKRAKLAHTRQQLAYDMQQYATEHFERMSEYVFDSMNDLKKAEDNVKNILKACE